MVINQRTLFLLFTFFICQHSLAAFSYSFLSTQDTIPVSNVEYMGNRIIVKSIKIVKKRGSKIKIEYNLVNSGRNKIRLGKGKNIPNDLIILFDKSLEENELLASKASFIENLKNQSISIRPGQLMMKNKLKFEYSAIPPSDRIAEKTSSNEENTSQENETIAQENEITKEEKIEIENTNTPIDSEKTTFEEAVKDIVIEVPLPKDMDKKMEEPDVELGETILVQEDTVSNQEEILETETVLTPSKNEDNNVFDIIETLPLYTEKEIKTKESNKEEIIVKKEEENVVTISQEKQCADLVMQNVHIIKKKKRYVTIECTITNIGNIPISLFGESKKEADNIAVQAHLTRSGKLTKGAIFVKGFFIKKGLKDKKGTLAPNESFTQKIKIETSKLTKFTPVLTISLDPFHIVKECNELNNVVFINLTEEDAPSSNPTPILEFESTEKGELSKTVGNEQ